jgi:hypothetical protein
MADIWLNVDAALSEVPVNILPLIDDSDFKTIKASVAYNAAGLALQWNFVDTTGAMTQTAVTPTTGGAYDWANQGNGMYSIEIPASAGGSINNDTEGFGWFSGVATGVLPWRGPIIGFRKQLLNDALINGNEWLPVDAFRPVFAVAAGTLTVKKVDGTTTAHTKSVSTDAAAVPIIGAT